MDLGAGVWVDEGAHHPPQPREDDWGAVQYDASGSLRVVVAQQREAAPQGGGVQVLQLQACEWGRGETGGGCSFEKVKAGGEHAGLEREFTFAGETRREEPLLCDRLQQAAGMHSHVALFQSADILTGCTLGVVRPALVRKGCSRGARPQAQGCQQVQGSGTSPLRSIRIHILRPWLPQHARDAISSACVTNLRIGCTGGEAHLRALDHLPSDRNVGNQIAAHSPTAELAGYAQPEWDLPTPT